MIQNFVIVRNTTIMTTNSTMTLFAQVIQYLPKEIIKSLIRKHQADKQAKGFGTWEHLVSCSKDSLQEPCSNAIAV